MEPYESSGFDSVGRGSIDTIFLNLPVQLTAEDPWCNSEIMRSEHDQFFLVIYDATHKVVSKQKIYLEVSVEHGYQLKSISDSVNDNTASAAQISFLSSQDVILNSLPDQISKTCHTGDTLELAMQETDIGLLQLVPYEIKLAALNALILSVETPEKTVLSCAICEKVYEKKFDLKNHISRHFGLHIFLCPVCGRQFSHSSNLNRHLRAHSGAKPCKCQDCDKRSSQINSLLARQTHIHSDDSKIHCCPICGRHCRVHHENESIDLSIPRSAVAKRKFYCSNCGENFALKSLLMQHKETEKALVSPKEVLPVKEVTFNETPCAEIQLLDAVDSIDSMLREIQHGNNAHISMGLVLPKVTDTVNQTIEDVISKISKHICFECGKQFRRYISYKQHWGVHETSLRKFECKKCGMVFAWKSTYVKHTIQFHSSEPRTILSCSEADCQKEYKSLNQLQEHIKRDHHLIRKFTCEECNKQFYKGHDLLVHKRTHSKDKPYMCGTCGKSFSHISHVIRHEKSHNNIRPHTCPLCRKSFTQATVLRAHRKTKCPNPTIDVVSNPEGIIRLF